MTLPDAGQSQRHDPSPSPGEEGPCRSPLTSEDIARLSSRIAEGDLKARNTLVQANLHLVYPVARRYMNRGLNQDDLIGEGNLGLIRAADGYDPALGTRFSTYATYWIKEAMISALINTGRTIRLPGNVSRLLARWQRTEQDIRRTHGRSPSSHEIATAMGLDEATQELMARAQVVTHLQVASVLSDRRATWAFMMVSGWSTAEEVLEAEEEQILVFRRLERLEGQLRTVVTLRFGLGGEAPMTYSDISNRLGIKRDTVRKLTTTAMEKLGHSR